MGTLPPRILGTLDAGHPGPTVVLIGGLHGNEPAGIEAIRGVLEALARGTQAFRGRIVGVSGNRAALAADRRYLVRDLNRGWTQKDIVELPEPGSGRDSPEDREQREILEVLVPVLHQAVEPVVFLDLHSTSGPGFPFLCMADVLRNRTVAFALPVPLILGIEEILDGSLLGYLCDLGHVGIAIEGGQSSDPRTRRHHEAAVWLALVALGCLTKDDVADLRVHRDVLGTVTSALPRVVEIRHRHPVAEDDGFAMEPGFASFTPVERGRVLAHDRRGPILAKESGVILMPRYQGQGDDGFFLARAVSPFWLHVSALLRRLRMDRLVPLLPGVGRHPTEPDHFVVDPKVARYHTVDVFHLLGYRHIRGHAGGLLFSRRRPGFRGVSSLPEELRPFLYSNPSLKITSVETTMA